MKNENSNGATKETTMKTYTNTSEAWGDYTGGLTVDDYRKQAVAFGLNPACITADERHVYAMGEIIGDAE